MESTALDTILASMTGIFGTVSTAGVTIVTAAIGLGVTFLGAKWLWGKVRQWLAKA